VTGQRTVPLSEVADVFNGKTPSKAEQRSSGHPVLKIRDVTELGEFRGSFESFVDDEFASRHASKRARVGDTLILNAAHNSAYVASKTFRVGPEASQALATGEWLIVRPAPEQLNPDYAHHFLNSVDARTAIRDMVKGIHLYPKDVLRLRVPVPPLCEQERIAEVLDRTDALRAKRRAALAKLDTLTQAIFLDMFGEPETNPRCWPRGTLGDVATFVGGGTPSRACPEFFTGQICWATSKDMKGEFIKDTEEHITAEAIERSATNLVPAGTILVVVKSKILAHSLPVAIARVPICFGQDLKGIKVSSGYEIGFVATSLRYGKNWLLEKARGINTEGLTLEHLRAFPLCLPPTELQERFARLIDVVEGLRNKSRGSLAEFDALFSSLQHRAFRGEL
jgi:type I restriction enzyme S subunit